MSGLKGRLIGNNLNFLLSELYRNNAHLGDFTTTWNKDLVLFIYGLHNYHCIFDTICIKNSLVRKYIEYLILSCYFSIIFFFCVHIK